MFKTSKLATAVKLASIAGAASFALSAPVFAQDDSAPEDEAVEKIQVTGSRLAANPNLAAAMPVLSVAGEEANIRGNVRIEDFVNVLPQVFAGQASEVSNGATGTATLNLRGLGAQRTLVLIDGRRLPYGSSSTIAANLDLVPTQLVERIDILTGGASAVYGSDAVSGVANFVLKKNFEGVEVGGNFSSAYNGNDDGIWNEVLDVASQPVPDSGWDGQETLAYMMFGANTDDGRGNVTVFASFENRNEIVQRDRNFSACSLGLGDGPLSFGGYECGGSLNFRFFGGDGGFGFQNEDGTIDDLFSVPAAISNFNFGQFNFFQRPSQRWNMYARAHYELTDDLEAYMDLSYTNNFSDAQIAPTASFGSGWDINCDNPLIQTVPDGSALNLLDIYGCSPEDVANGVIKQGNFASHRNVEGGNRNSRLENSAFRWVGGLRGYIDDTWAWSAFAQISETQDQSIATEDFVVANVQQAFLVTTDASGNPVCIDPSGGCVPYNIFQRGPNGESLVTQEALDFIQGPGIVNGKTSQKVYGADIQANLGDYGIQSPFSDAGIGFLAGVEYREDSLESEPDVISRTPGGGFTGVGGADLPVAGRAEVSEIFAEVEVPLVTDAEFAKELTLRAQYRFSDYEVDGNGVTNSFDTDAYGVSLSWAPIEDVKFRAQYQRAVRAPNVIELFTGQNTGLPNLQPAGVNANNQQLFDPCASDQPIASLEQCQRTGVTAAQYGTILDVIAGQTQSLTGGNPLLEPEVADTVTLGVVITPESIPDLSISIDYFDIQVEEAIAAGIPAQTTLDNCLASGDPVFCDLITRDGRGSLAAGAFGTGFQQTNINIAELGTSGIDLQITYRLDLDDMGTINFDYASTWLDENSFTPFPGAEIVECAGIFGGGCGTPAPEYRHRFIATWDSPWDVQIAATWRYFGATDNQQEGSFENELETVNYLDLTALYNITDNTEVRVGVLNLLNEQPPVFTAAGPPFGNGNTFPTVFDTSTVAFVGFRANF